MIFYRSTLDFEPAQKLLCISGAKFTPARAVLCGLARILKLHRTAPNEVKVREMQSSFCAMSKPKSGEREREREITKRNIILLLSESLLSLP